MTTTTPKRRTRVKGKPGIYYRHVSGRRRYEITFRDTTGRQRWETVPGFDNLDAAETLRDERRGSKRRGEPVAPAGARFADVVRLYLDSPQFARLAPTTRKEYGAALRVDGEIMRRFGRMKIAAVDSEQLARFIHSLSTRQKLNGSKGTPRRSTVENALKPMRGVFRRAVKERMLAASPFASLDRDDRPRPDEEPHKPHEWTDAELETLLQASKTRATKAESKHDYSVLLTVAAKAGLRLGECLGLDWPDCELVKGEGAINVRRQWTRLKELAPPKAGSRRRVPISDSLVQLLLELKMASPNKSGPVFAAKTGGRLAYRNVERRGFDAAAEDVGLTDVTFHDLRHAYGSRLASKGLSARQIADAMGHKKTATTEIYIQRFNGEQADQRLREAMTG